MCCIAIKLNLISFKNIHLFNSFIYKEIILLISRILNSLSNIVIHIFLNSTNMFMKNADTNKK